MNVQFHFPRSVLALILLTIGLAACGTGSNVPSGGNGADPNPPTGHVLFTVMPQYRGVRNYIINADGTNQMPLPAFGDFSPDRQKIVYQFDPPAARSRVCVVNVDGSDHHCLVEGLGPTWSPDGRQILFAQVAEPSDSLALINADGTGLTQLGEGRAPQWSPDGRTIMFFLNDPPDQSKTGIYLINPDGTGRRRLINGVDPAWSPDGSRIVFQSDDSRCHGICIVNVGGAILQELTDGNRPQWSPDGKRIVFWKFGFSLGAVAASNVYVINADGTGLKQLTSQYYNDPACWLPDGQHIAFLSKRDGAKLHIFMMRDDGSYVRRLTRNADEEGLNLRGWTAFVCLPWTASPSVNGSGTITSGSYDLATAVPAPTRRESQIVFPNLFTDPSSQWPSGQVHDLIQGTRIIGNGKYLWDFTRSPGAPDLPTIAVANEDAPGDLSLTTDVKITTGQDNAVYGVIIRYNNGSGYGFEIYRDTYSVSYYQNNQFVERLNSSTESTAVRPGEVNHLAVTAIGSHLYFAINGQSVFSGEDTRLTQGRVGVVVDPLITTTDRTVIEFSNMQVAGQ